MWKNFIFIVIFLISSCSSDRPQGATEAEVLFKESKKLFEDGKYIQATEKLNGLKSQYPYSYFAKDAELLLADILFSQENYIESAAAYLLFRELHPKFENIQYVVLRIAESYYKQLPPTYDRDLSMAHEAIKYYKEIVERFPSSDHASVAKERIERCTGMLRDKERYIADFYFKTDDYSSARYHYLEILNQFDEKDLRAHAMKRVVLASYSLGDFKECQNYYKKFKYDFGDDLKNHLETIYESCQQKELEK